MADALERADPGTDRIRDGAVAGFATGMFSVPEGMAYAQLAGVPPVYGLYSGVVATFVAALTTRTVLMISTLTASISLTTGNILESADIVGDDVPGALFMITLLTGGVMLALGLLRLGVLVDFVSSAVMTGFVVGASLLIMIGELGEFSGYEPVGANKIAKVVDWVANVGSWDRATTITAAATVVTMVACKSIERLERAAAVITLVVMTAVIAVLDPSSVALVRDIAEIPSSLPTPRLPDFSAAPDVALGSISVAIVALVQGAGISTAYPNPRGPRASASRDFIGEGAGNVAGAFFQSMPTGGSLSRTAISVSAGAKSRWGGVFAAFWLAVLVVLFAPLAERVPLPVIAGLLTVIAAEIIIGRRHSVAVILRSSWQSSAAMLATFGTALFIPLQWTIFVGAVLSTALYLRMARREVRLVGLRRERGRWTECDVPDRLDSGSITVVEYEGAGYFAEAARLHEQLPRPDGASGSVLVIQARRLDHLNATGVGFITAYAEELAETGNHLVLADVHSGVRDVLERSGVVELLGPRAVIEFSPTLTGALDDAWSVARSIVDEQRGGRPDGDDAPGEPEQPSPS